MKSNQINLIKKLKIDILNGRYHAIHSIGDSYGGMAFKGYDKLTETDVFIKYLIGFRGIQDSAKFLMERDALINLKIYETTQVSPELLYFEEFPEILSAVIITEFVPGESLTEWLKSSHDLSVEKKIEVFHRIIYALSCATRLFKHRDIHPGNIILLAEDQVLMGPLLRPNQVDPGIRIIDWGESLPVIFGNYDDEPEHNFTLLEISPLQIGGSITSLPPEVFSPWTQNSHFGGEYECWGMGLLLYRILANKSVPRIESLGHYVKNINDGTLKNDINSHIKILEQMKLPGGRIFPYLLKRMLQISPASRLSLSEVTRVFWDVQYEELSISDEKTIEKYLSNVSGYIPPQGWKYSSIPDFYG